MYLRIYNKVIKDCCQKHFNVMEEMYLISLKSRLYSLICNMNWLLVSLHSFVHKRIANK